MTTAEQLTRIVGEVTPLVAKLNAQHEAMYGQPINAPSDTAYCQIKDVIGLEPDAFELPEDDRILKEQIVKVSSILTVKLRALAELAGAEDAGFADTEQLQFVTAHGVLADIFFARADIARPFDANWIKAQYYRDQFNRLQLRLRLTTEATK